jgi:hypothetical protein
MLYAPTYGSLTQIGPCVGTTNAIFLVDGVDAVSSAPTGRPSYVRRNQQAKQADRNKNLPCHSVLLTLQPVGSMDCAVSIVAGRRWFPFVPNLQ